MVALILCDRRRSCEEVNYARGIGFLGPFCFFAERRFRPIFAFLDFAETAASRFSGGRLHILEAHQKC